MRVEQRYQAVKAMAGVNPEAALQLMECLRRPDDPENPVKNSAVRERLASDEFMGAARTESSPLMRLVLRKETAEAVTLPESLRLMKAKPGLAESLARLSAISFDNRNCVEILLEGRRQDSNLRELLDSTNGEQILSEWSVSKPERVREFLDALQTGKKKRSVDILRLKNRAYVNETAVAHEYKRSSIDSSVQEAYNRLFQAAPELSHESNFIRDFEGTFRGNPYEINLLNALAVIAESQKVEERGARVLSIIENKRLRQNLGDYMEITASILSGTHTREQVEAARVFLLTPVVGEHIQRFRDLPTTQAEYKRLLKARANTFDYENPGHMEQQINEVYASERLAVGAKTESALKGIPGLSPGFSSEYVNTMMDSNQEGRACWESMRSESIAKLSSIHGQHPALFGFVKIMINQGRTEDALSVFHLCDGGVTPRMEYLAQHKPEVVDRMVAAKKAGRDQTAGLLSTCAIQRQTGVANNPHSEQIIKLVESQDHEIQGFLSNSAVSEWAQLARDHIDLFGQMLEAIERKHFKTARLCAAARNLGDERDYIAVLAGGEINEQNAEEVQGLLADRNALRERLKQLAGEETQADRDAKARKAQEDADRLRADAEAQAAKVRDEAAKKQRMQDVSFIRDLIADTFADADERRKALEAYRQAEENIAPNTEAFDRLFTVMQRYIPETQRLEFFTRVVSSEEQMNFFANNEAVGRVTLLTGEFVPEASRTGFVQQAVTNPNQRRFYTTVSQQGFENLAAVARNFVPQESRADFISHATSSQNSLEIFHRKDVVERFGNTEKLPAELRPEYLEHIITYSSNFEEYTSPIKLRNGMGLCNIIVQTQRKAGLITEESETAGRTARNIFLRPPAVYNMLTDRGTSERALRIFNDQREMMQMDRNLAEGYLKALTESPELVNPHRDMWIVNAMRVLSHLSARYPEIDRRTLFLPEMWNSDRLEEMMQAVIRGTPAPAKERVEEGGLRERTERPKTQRVERGEVRWRQQLYLTVVPGEPQVLNPMHNPRFRISEDLTFDSPSLGTVPVAEVFQGVDTSIVKASEMERIRPRLTYHEEQLLTALSYHLGRMLERTEGMPEMNVNELRDACNLHPILGERYGKRPDLFTEDLNMLKHLGVVEGRANITLTERLWEVNFREAVVDRTYSRLNDSVSRTVLEKIGQMHTTPKAIERYKAYVVVMSNQSTPIVETERMIEECEKHPAFKEEKDVKTRLAQITETLREQGIVCSFRGQGYGIHPEYYVSGRKPAIYGRYPEVFSPLQTLQNCCEIENYGGGVMPDSRYSKKVKNPVTMERDVYRITVGSYLRDGQFEQGRTDMNSSQQRLGEQRVELTKALSNLNFTLDYGGKREHILHLVETLLPEIKDPARLLIMMRDRGILAQPDIGLYEIARTYVRRKDEMKKARSRRTPPSADKMDGNINETKIYEDVDEKFKTSKPYIRDRMKALLKLMSTIGVYIEAGARPLDLHRLMKQIASETSGAEKTAIASTIDGNTDALTQELPPGQKMTKRAGALETEEVETPGVQAVLKKEEVSSIKIVRINLQR